jgi:hypothetical protein
VLAYNCASGQCDGNAGGGCTRVNRYSNTFAPYSGAAIGNASNNNAQQINNVRVEVSQYFNSGPTPPPTNAPTKAPTASPTNSPTKAPTPAPTDPTAAPITAAPTKSPTPAPTQNCTQLGKTQCQSLSYCSWSGKNKVCSFNTSSPVSSPVAEPPTAEPPVGGPGPSECSYCSATGQQCCGICVSSGKPSSRGCFV